MSLDKDWFFFITKRNLGGWFYNEYIGMGKEKKKHKSCELGVKISNTIYKQNKILSQLCVISWPSVMIWDGKYLIYK